MNESRRRLMQGVILGTFMGAGFVFVVFWRIMTAATNAGAMVDGQFHPYHTDPSWHILLGGGLIMIVVASVFLLVTWRGLGRS